MANDKLKEALHYVISLCDDPSKLGAIRLNKILWFADQFAYRLNGNSITAGSYIKRRLGPVPKHVLSAIGELAAEGQIVMRERSLPSGNVMRDFITMKQPTFETLSEQDRELLSSYTDLICNSFSANEISDLTHDQVWEAAETGEEIPLYATLAQPGEITLEVREWASEIANSLAAA